MGHIQYFSSYPIPDSSPGRFFRKISHNGFHHCNLAIVNENLSRRGWSSREPLCSICRKSFTIMDNNNFPSSAFSQRNSCWLCVKLNCFTNNTGSCIDNILKANEKLSYISRSFTARLISIILQNLSHVNAIYCKLSLLNIFFFFRY